MPSTGSLQALCGAGSCVLGGNGQDCLGQGGGNGASATAGSASSSSGGVGGFGSGAGGASVGVGGGGGFGTGGFGGSGGGQGVGAGGAGAGAGGATSSGATSGTGTSGTGTSSGAGGSPPLTCQLAPAGKGAAARCVPAGPFKEDQPCQDASDCAPGLGCVGAAPVNGYCHRYCCGDPEACSTGTYCAAQPLFPVGASLAKIPVCIAATRCTLLDDSTCLPGLTCTIVRLDGTTSCIPPGAGLMGDACPCAAGYVCSALDDTCQKLCHLAPSGNDCPTGGVCQGGVSAYPPGFGVCFGY